MRALVRMARVALLSGTALAAAQPTLAQTLTAEPPVAAAATTPSQEEIVVTGSLIARSGYTSPQPLSLVTAADLAKTGATNIGQITQLLPAFQAFTTPASTAFTSNRAGGSYLNLRGLGDNRTLVLVNGRRFPATNSEATVDTNVIPSSLIDRVEVVTGGASAAYGSDAVAGVVNIILKDKLDGFLGDTQAGSSSRGDNTTYKGSLAWGATLGGGRGHLIVAAEGERNEGVGLQTTRGWASRGFAVVGNPFADTPANLIRPGVQFSLQTLGGLVRSGVLRGTDFGPGGVPRAFAAAPGDGFSQIGGSGVVGADYITLSVPFDRYSLFGKGDYDLGGVTAFAEVSHARSAGDLPIIPASNFGSIVIQRDNAFLDPGLAARLAAAGETSFRLARFFADLGPLTVKLSNTTDRAVFGLRGDLGGTWRWNAYGQYGRTLAVNDRGNNQNLALFARSTDAVRGPGGAPVCRVNADADPANNDPACVPVNLFGNGSISDAAKTYFLGVSRLRSVFEQWIGGGTITGDVARLNGEPIAVAAGASFRSETVDAVADPISQVDGFAFGNPKSIAGGQDVTEVFGELAVPLVRALGPIRAVDLNGAVRWTDYSGSGSVVTWKAGGTLDLGRDVRFRATRSRDIRAPNLGELFGNSNVNFVTVRDPRFGTTVNVPETTRGNPVLRPESADTLTAGVVFTPSFLPGFRASVDWYDISIGGAVAILSSQDTLNRCQAGNTALCAFVARDANGILTALVRTQVNVATVATRGVDIEASLARPLLGGQVTVRALANFVDTLSTSNGGITIDRAGEVGGNNNGLPNWRFNVGVTYTKGPWTLFALDRYVGGGNYDNTLGPADLDRTKVGDANYVDLSVQYDLIARGRRKVSLFVVGRNVLDQDPPLAPSNTFVAYQTNPVLYDVVGAYVSGGVRFGF